MIRRVKICKGSFCGPRRRMADSEVNDGAQYFEGVEKLLELWFTRSDGNAKQCDLRKIPR